MIEILEFFKGLGDAVVSVFEFIIAFFRDFMSFLKVLAHLPEILSGVLVWIPSGLLSALLVLLGIVIVYKILGREG